MTQLYVYALVSTPPRQPGEGISAEAIRAIGCGEVVALCGEVETAPAAGEAAVRAHDAIVRRLAAGTGALLPVRFGTVLPDAAALNHTLQPHAGDLKDALALVEGREQMTLRIFIEGPRKRLTPVELHAVTGDAEAGPGARYLARLLRAHKAARSVPELAPLRAALETLVAAERVEPQPSPPLVASVYHLIRRGDGPAYAAVVEKTASRCRPARISASGPWPAWGFAPEVLS